MTKRIVLNESSAFVRGPYRQNMPPRHIVRQTPSLVARWTCCGRPTGHMVHEDARWLHKDGVCASCVRAALVNGLATEEQHGKSDDL